MSAPEHPKISVIMPAYNASETLDRSIQSVIDQDFHDWEIIIIDDGSTDDTGILAQNATNQDQRIVYIKQDNAGVSAARNTAIKHAKGDWILFLDSDDTLDNKFLSKMIKSANDNNSDIVICEYMHCSHEDRTSITDRCTKLPKDAITELMIWPYFAVHAAITKRDRVVASGGFDTTLRTCEDWDFWIKIMAQDGVTYSNVNEILAFYHNTPDSLSKGASDMFADCREIRRRQKAGLYGPQASKYEMNEAQSILKDTQEMCWYVAVDAAQGHDKTYIHETFDTIASPFGNDIWLSECVFEGLNVGACVQTRDTYNIWPKTEQTIKKLFDIVEERTGHNGAADLLMHDLYHVFSKKCDLAAPLYYKDQAYLKLIPFLIKPELPSEIQSLNLYFTIKGKTHHLRGIPVFAPLSRFGLLRIIFFEICNKLFQTQSSRFPVGHAAKSIRKFVKLRGLIRSKFFKRNETENRALKAYNTHALRQLIRAIKAKAPVSDNTSKLNQRQEEELDYFSDDVWEKIFKTENPWNYDNTYEQIKYQQTLDLLPEQPYQNALELACAEGHFTIDLADRVKHLKATDISQTAVERAAERCKDKDNIEYGVLDFVKDPIEGQYDLIVCSEVLYYTKDKEQLFAVADKIANALTDEGYLIMAHARLIEDDMSRTAFGWGDTQGVETIIETFLSHEDLTSSKVFTTELYEIHLIQKSKQITKAEVIEGQFGTPLAGHVAADIVWGSAHATRYQTQVTEHTRQLPILMYHSIAENAPEPLQRYTVSPSEFEKQLRYMHRRGFYSIDPDLLNPAQQMPWDMQGRPTILTFDDAYVDFLETAWPIIQRNGFKAHIFVPTDYVGGRAEWDKEYGEPAEIMNWDQIKYLASQGVTFGSHLASHSAATTLSNQELLEEALTSKWILEDKIGKAVNTVAPPYGAMGKREERILQIAGYGAIFEINTGDWATIGKTVLSRVFPDGTKDLNEFAQNFPDHLPAPDQYDLNNETFKTIF